MRLVIVESPFAPQTPLPPHPWTSNSCTCHTHDVRDLDYEECPKCVEYHQALKVRTAETARNARYLDACLLDCLRRGEAPFASHAIYTRPGVLDDLKPAERALGIAAGFAWRAVAHATAFYIDLGWSRGMRAAEEHALREKVESVHAVEIRKLGGDWSTQ